MTVSAAQFANLRIGFAAWVVLVFAGTTTSPGVKAADPVEFERGGMNLIFKPVMVATIAVSPDGNWLAAGTGFFDQPGELVLWDVAARKVKWVQPYDIGIRAVAISPNGKLVASGHFDNRARLTNAATGAVVATLAGHTGGVNSVVFTPDGKSLVTGSLDASIKIWNVEKQTLVRTLPGHQAEVYSVAVSPDGRKIASGSRDATARLWNFETGKELLVLAGHDQAVEMVAFAPQASLLATASWDATVKFWNTETGEEQATLRHAARVNALAFTADGKRLVTVPGATHLTDRSLHPPRIAVAILATESLTLHMLDHEIHPGDLRLFRVAFALPARKPPQLESRYG